MTRNTGQLGAKTGPQRTAQQGSRDLIPANKRPISTDDLAELGSTFFPQSARKGRNPADLLPGAQ